MLTTYDNPYSPFDQFNEWLLFDIQMGYNSCDRLGRIVKLEDDMSDVEKEKAMQDAIDEIIKYDDAGIFVRATVDNPIPGLKS
jgi:hypothetical protein